MLHKMLVAIVAVFIIIIINCHTEDTEKKIKENKTKNAKRKK